ncbi:hypothetical protein GCM10010208_04080 [Actinomadura livida]|nr:hypothetical protein GCM10010208_04080 [Actinomadura livida]
MDAQRFADHPAVGVRERGQASAERTGDEREHRVPPAGPRPGGGPERPGREVRRRLPPSPRDMLGPTVHGDSRPDTAVLRGRLS